MAPVGTTKGFVLLLALVNTVGAERGGYGVVAFLIFLWMVR